MGSEQLLKAPGVVVRHDRIAWGDWGDHSATLTEDELEMLRRAYAPKEPPVELATEFKRLKELGLSLRQMVAAQADKKGWSLRNIAKVSRALNTPPPEVNATPSPDNIKSVAFATLSIDL